MENGISQQKLVTANKQTNEKFMMRLKCLWHFSEACSYSDQWPCSATSEVNGSLYYIIRLKTESEPVWRAFYNSCVDLPLTKWNGGEDQMVLKLF